MQKTFSLEHHTRFMQQYDVPGQTTDITRSALEKAWIMSTKNPLEENAGSNHANFRDYPKLLSLVLSGKCNYRCTFCFSKDQPGGFLSVDKIKKLRKPLEKAVIIDLTGVGEPLLHPQFFEIVNYIASVCQNPRWVQLTSNGSLATREHAALLRDRLRRIVFSINAANAQTYARLMLGGDFLKTTERIRNFLSEINDEDRNRSVGSFVTSQDNYQEMPDFIVLAKKLGLKTVSFLPIIVTRENARDKSIFFIQEDFNSVGIETRRIAKELGITCHVRLFGEKKGRPKNREESCPFPFTDCFISADGRMGACCFGSRRVPGDAYDNFEDMWFSESLQELRKSRSDPACAACYAFETIDNLDTHIVKR